MGHAAENREELLHQTALRNLNEQELKKVAENSKIGLDHLFNFKSAAGSLKLGKFTQYVPESVFLLFSKLSGLMAVITVTIPQC